MATWKDGPEYAPVERPFGFAQPDAAPLPHGAPPPPLPASPNGTPPQDMQEPTNAIPLAKLEPAQEESRDPKIPFAVAQTVANSALVQAPEPSEVQAPDPSAWGAVRRAPSFPPPDQMPPVNPQMPGTPWPAQQSQPSGQAMQHGLPQQAAGVPPQNHGSYPAMPGQTAGGFSAQQPPINQYPPGARPQRAAKKSRDQMLIVAMGSFGLGIFLLPISFVLLMTGITMLHFTFLMEYPKLMNTARGFFGLAFGTWLIKLFSPELWSEIVFALTEVTDATFVYQLLCVMCCLGSLIICGIGLRVEGQQSPR